MRSSAAPTLRPALVSDEVAPRSADRLGSLETKTAIAGGILAILAMLASVVWLLATLAADVASIKEEIPPGAFAKLDTALEGFDRRLQLLEDRK